MKAARQSVLHTMHLDTNMTRRNAYDFANRLRVQAFQVEKHQLSVERLEQTDQVR